MMTRRLFDNQDNNILRYFTYAMNEKSFMEGGRGYFYDVFYHGTFCRTYEVAKPERGGYSDKLICAKNRLKELVITALMEYDVRAAKEGKPLIIDNLDLTK